MEVQEEALYQDVYGGERTFCTVLSDGNNIELLPGGKDRPVKCDERQQYTSLVRRARMTEFTKQVSILLADEFYNLTLVIASTLRYVVKPTEPLPGNRKKRSLNTNMPVTGSVGTLLYEANALMYARDNCSNGLK